MYNKGFKNDPRNKSLSKTKRSKNGKIRPWIPPPAKTSGSLSNLNIETKPRSIKNKVCENETLQDIQKKVTELDSFVKSLDSVLGRVGKELGEEDETKLTSEILHSKTEKKRNESTTNKVKEYKKKVKLLLEVASLSELEVNKMKEILEEKENALSLMIKERDHFKFKLQESDKEKGEVKLKLETILQKLNEIENNQVLRESKYSNFNQGHSDALAKLREENSNLKATELDMKTQIAKYETEIKHLKDKIRKWPKGGEKKEIKSVDATKLQNTIETMEKQNVFFQNTLKTMERQLEEAHCSIYQLTSDLNKAREKLQKGTHSTREDLSMTNSEDLKALHDELLAKRIRINVLEENVNDKTVEIAKITEEKNKLEDDYGKKLKICERQLEISLNTNRSLQNYLTHLKNSYASVFSQPFS